MQVDNIAPPTLYGVGVYLNQGKIAAMAADEVFFGVALRESEYYCGKYGNINYAYMDVIQDAFVHLEVSGTNIKLGDFVTVEVGGTFAKSTDSTLAIGRITSALDGASVFEVELFNNNLLLTIPSPEEHSEQQTPTKPKTPKTPKTLIGGQNNE